MTEPRNPPGYRRMVACVAFVWISAAASATVAIWRGDWVGVVPTMTTAIAGAGWYVAVRQWVVWRRFALVFAARLGFDEIGGEGDGPS